MEEEPKATSAARDRSGAPDPTTAYTPADQRTLAGAEAQTAAEWQVGDTILNLYQVTGLLGEGGMGKVFKVRHTGWNVDLAVKSPRPEVLARAGGHENFVREAETWVKLGLHPHVVSCYYVRALGGTPRVFAEYVEGGSLAEWIRTRRLYEGGPERALERILDVAIQFAWGLDHAHGRGLIHQDIKPANVMMTSDGTAKVTDFGLAKARGHAGEAEPAAPGASILVSVGGMTPAYCSPEQAAHQPLSRQTDIWSWGLSVLEMFAGEVSWLAGQAAREALENHLESDSGEQGAPRMPESVAQLLRHCFEPNPPARPGAMTEVAQALGAAYGQLLRAPHARPRPKAADHTADTLNNRALSLLDLGREREALATWQQALVAEPRHPDALYNRGLVLWRSTHLTDQALLRQLDPGAATPDERWQSRLVRALVHLERGDLEAADELIRQSEQLAPEEVEPRQARSRVEAGWTPRVLHVFERVPNHAPVVSIAPTSDGRRAVSADADRALRLWDLQSGRCLRTFTGHVHHLNAVCLSPDDRYAVSCSKGASTRHAPDERSLRLWEIETGRCLHTFGDHRLHVTSASFSADGRLVVTGSESEPVGRIWEAQTGRCLRILEGHERTVRSAAFSPDGLAIVSGGDDGALRLWEVVSGRCVRVIASPGRGEAVLAVAFGDGGRLALSGGSDKTMRLWDLTNGTCLRNFEGHGNWVADVRLSPDGRWAVSRGSAAEDRGDWTVRLWDVNTGRCLRTIFEGPAAAGVTAIALGRDGRLLLEASLDMLRLFRLPDAAPRPSPFRNSRPQSHAALSAIERRATALLDTARSALEADRLQDALAAARELRGLRGRAPDAIELWERLGRACGRSGLRDALPRARMPSRHGRRLSGAAVAANGRLSASFGMDGTVDLWELPAGRSLSSVHVSEEAVVTSIGLSGDGRLAVVSFFDDPEPRPGQLWELPAGRRLRVFAGHAMIKAASISRDGRLVLSAGTEGAARLWDARSGRPLRAFQHGQPGGHGRSVGVECAALSGNGRFALTGAFDGLVRLWDVASGRCVRELAGHSEPVCCVSFSVDGRRALSGSADQTARLWDLETGGQAAALEHEGPVECATLSPDGRFAITGGRDFSPRLWEISSGRCLKVFDDQEHAALSAAFAPDGAWAFFALRDGTLRTWSLDWELESHDPATWDERARPHLEAFLDRQTPFAGVLPADRQPTEDEITLALTRRGRPSWTESDFEDLLFTLRCAGYGWLRHDGVREKLLELASHRQGSSRAPGTEEAGAPSPRPATRDETPAAPAPQRLAASLMVKGVKTRDRALRQQALNAFVEDVTKMQRLEKHSALVVLMAFAIETDEALRIVMGYVVVTTGMLPSLKSMLAFWPSSDVADLDTLVSLGSQSADRLTAGDLDRMAERLRANSTCEWIIRKLFGENILDEIAAEQRSAPPRLPEKERAPRRPSPEGKRSWLSRLFGRDRK